MNAVVFLFLCLPSFADDRLDHLLTCARALGPAPGGPIVSGDSVILANYADGWALLTFDRTMTYRCALPPAIETCFRANPRCTAFDFLIAHPGGGAGVTFHGDAIDDHRRVDRLDAFRPLARGTVEDGGRITKIIRGAANPVLGLKCVADRGPASLAALERAVGGELARRGDAAKVGSACAGVFAGRDAGQAPALIPSASSGGAAAH